MSTCLVDYRPLPVIPAVLARHIKKVGLVGSGEVIQKKILPALQRNHYQLDAIAVCGLESSSVLSGMPHVYLPVVANGLLPLDELERGGFLGADTLWIIATPSAFHVPYVLQLAACCVRIGIEKPVATSYRLAKLLLPFTDNGHEIYQIDHKLFNASALAFIERCRQQPSVLERVRRIEAIFYETDGITNGRHQEDVIADIQYHLLTIMISIFKATGTLFSVVVESALVAKHEPDAPGRFQAPQVWTASRLAGLLHSKKQRVRYDFRQAKGAPKNEKMIRLFGAGDALVGTISLNETGGQAHARVLDALIKPVVDMRHTLADAIEVMRLVDASRDIAREEPAYVFGGLPGFL